MCPYCELNPPAKQEFAPFGVCDACWAAHRRWAWNIYNRALRSGSLVKPEQCSECERSAPEYKIVGHHTDYTKPLEVEWVCERCHARAHRKAKKVLHV